MQKPGTQLQGKNLGWARGGRGRDTHLKVPLSDYRASSFWVTAPASVFIQTPAGLNAIMPHRWRACLAGVSAILTVMTHPCICFPMGYGFVVLLFSILKLSLY